MVVLEGMLLRVSGCLPALMCGPMIFRDRFCAHILSGVGARRSRLSKQMMGRGDLGDMIVSF